MTKMHPDDVKHWAGLCVCVMVFAFKAGRYAMICGSSFVSSCNRTSLLLQHVAFRNAKDHPGSPLCAYVARIPAVVEEGQHRRCSDDVSSGRAKSFELDP